MEDTMGLLESCIRILIVAALTTGWYLLPVWVRWVEGGLVLAFILWIRPGWGTNQHRPLTSWEKHEQLFGKGGPWQ